MRWANIKLASWKHESFIRRFLIAQDRMRQKPKDFVSCRWSEGSLAMAENIIREYLGGGLPAWLSEDQWQRANFTSPTFDDYEGDGTRGAWPPYASQLLSAPLSHLRAQKHQETFLSMQSRHALFPQGGSHRTKLSSAAHPTILSAFTDPCG